MVAWLTAQMTEFPAIQGRPERIEKQDALGRIAQNVLIHRNWIDDTTEPMRTCLQRAWPHAN